MPGCRVTFAQSAHRELERLDARVVGRVFPKIEALAQNPRPPRCRKLSGFNNLWRIRVGDWRVVYSIDDDNSAVDIVTVRHRSTAYKP
ncbi:MAG: type II toxin-antitoxin system RelE/ParE family toxin [Chloroflexi bacterium]|nr:type II toxin-antitoxin system RelE/ParE family toxin [Chloroflexota bacterium]